MKQRHNTLALLIGMVGALLLATMQPAQAGFMMRLSEGANIVTIADGGGNDQTGTAGLITFIGGIGTFSINVTIGSSKPVLGSATSPQLNITSLNATSAGAGTLTIELTDTDFGPLSPSAGFETLINGTRVPGTLGAAAYIDNTNAEFGQGAQVGNIAAQGPGPFDAQDLSGFIETSTPFSMTLVATVSHNAAGQVTTYDANLATVTVPEPSATLSLGISLSLLGLVGLHQRSRMRL